MPRAQYKRSSILGFLGLICFADKNLGYGVYILCACVTRLLCMIVYGNYSTYTDTNYEKVSVYTKFKS